MHRVFGLIIATTLFVSLPAFAESRNTGAPSILDPQQRHLKQHQLELTGFVGTYLGARINKSWITGARAYYHLHRILALGGSYGFSQHGIDLSDQSAAPRLEGRTHYLTGEVAFSSDVAMRMGSALLEMDLYATLGAGARRLDNNWGLLGLVGGGVKFYTPLSWIAVRIDVNNYIHQISTPDRKTIEMDVSFALGISMLLPPRAD